MKNYRPAAQSLVKFLHGIEPRSKKLTVHSKIGKFMAAGVLAPDLNAAIAYIETEFSVRMSGKPAEGEEFLEMTPVEYCHDGLQERKPTKNSLRKCMQLIAEIYREYIQAGPDVGRN